MSKDTVTLSQAANVLQMIAEKKVSGSRLQQIVRSGILADVFDERVNWKRVNRQLIQVGLGLKKTSQDQVNRLQRTVPALF